eukprot:Platyproteum_vivax@DN5406_c0_g1_i1.p1
MSEAQDIADLKKLQADSGIIPQSSLERLDWMYEFSSDKKDEQTREQYLLGLKSVDDPGASDHKDLKKLETIAGSLFLKSATQTNEDTLRRLREDPLLLIKQAELKKKQDFLSNPINKPLIVKKIKKEKKEKKEKKSKKEKKVKKERSGSRSRIPVKIEDGEIAGDMDRERRQHDGRHNDR